MSVYSIKEEGSRLVVRNQSGKRVGGGEAIAAAHAAGRDVFLVDARPAKKPRRKKAEGVDHSNFIFSAGPRRTRIGRRRKSSGSPGKYGPLNHTALDPNSW